MHCSACDKPMSEKEQKWDSRRNTLEDLCFDCLLTIIGPDALDNYGDILASGSYEEVLFILQSALEDNRTTKKDGEHQDD